MLADKIGMHETARRVTASLPAPDGLVLLTQREVCVVPGCEDLLILAPGNGSSLQAAHPALYTQTGVKKAELLQKRCCTCAALRYFSRPRPKLHAAVLGSRAPEIHPLHLCHGVGGRVSVRDWGSMQGEGWG